MGTFSVRRFVTSATVIAVIAALLLGGTALAVPSQPSSDPIDGATTNAQTAEFRAELERRRAELDAFQAQLEALDRELSIAAEAYNASVFELETTRRQLTVTKLDLDNAEIAFGIQSEQLSGRAREIYRNGELDILDVLFGAKSVTDLVARIQFLHTLGATDASIAETLRQQRDLVAAKAADLENAQLYAESLEFTLKARRIEVILRIQEREEMLSRAQTELLDLLDAEAARRQQEEAALMRAILSGANDAGIVVEPGSPIETALSYHGIPYVWGGASTSGFDCSGLVMYVFGQHGVNLPHYSGAQFQLGAKIVPADLRPGDVVFFGSPVHHVGIYVGGGYFIHAPRTGDFVKLSRLTERSDYAGARRYDWAMRTAPLAGAVVDPAGLTY
ncbi:MAG: NlpC/P60 family protein [Coriobacteriia bacterium]|nr:NlpC/P60 family protein [Coriobacteriia bacterium]